MKVRLILLSLVASVALMADPSAMAPEAIITRYCDAERGQQTLLKGASMEVEIEASLPRLKKEGRLHALRRISALGRITYQVLGFEGDGTVKNQVIARYLSAESEALKSTSESLAVIPANYKFKYRGKGQINGRDTYVFQVTPRKKGQGMYRGEIWIDTATYLRVRESGYLVKTPSIFLKKIAFIRSYDIRNGISVPVSVQSTVETRLVGKAQLNIDYSNFAPADAGWGGNEDQ